jgi:hypothetical protein
MTGKEKVYTYNIESDIIELENIEFVGKTRENVDVVEITIEENNTVYTLKCTPDHMIYTKNRGYVMASELNEDDNILLQEQKNMKV